MQQVATTCESETAATLPPQVVEQIAQLLKEWKLGEIGSSATPLPRLYVRPDEAAKIIGVSRRTLSAWQASRTISYRRVGRTILFSIADIQSALDRYRIAPIGEPKPRRQSVETSKKSMEPEPTRKRRMTREVPEAIA